MLFTNFNNISIRCWAALLIYVVMIFSMKRLAYKMPNNNEKCPKHPNFLEPKVMFV